MVVLRISSVLLSALRGMYYRLPTTDYLARVTDQALVIDERRLFGALEEVRVVGAPGTYSSGSSKNRFPSTEHMAYTLWSLVRTCVCMCIPIRGKGGWRT